jgi:Ribosomal protein L11 methyltransferase (PrmA)
MTYSTVFSHRNMVFDGYRNELYSHAIRELVTADSIVLDLGAGLGIHGLIAAAAGAKRVYLVEPESIVQIAREVAQTNRLADRIVVLEGQIEEVKLPEQVDIIVSAFTGNLLFSEDLLPSLFYARVHYLKLGGHLIPDLAELVMSPVAAPEMYEKYLGIWAQPADGLDFSAARRFAANDILWLSREELRAESLAPGVVLASVDLITTTKADCDGFARCEVKKSGLCHGLLGWIRLRLGTQWLASAPDEPRVHWSPVLLPIDPPLMLKAGEQIAIFLRRPALGDWTWSIKSGEGSRRNSTFLARADGLHRLRKIALDHCAGINPHGEITLRALTMMREGRSNGQIAQALFDAYRTRFTEFDEALLLVQRLVLRHGGDPGSSA